MAYSDGIITGAVSIYDVQRALGLSANDVGTLCKSTRINKFAKFKPVSYATMKTLTMANRISVNHGISFPDVVTGSGSLQNQGSNIADAAANDWGMILPSGGSNSPYRLSDFGDPESASSNAPGYNHEAVPPIQCNYPKDGWTFIKGSSTRQLVIQFSLDPAESDTNLQATDFTGAGLNLNEWKFVAFIDSIYFSQKVWEGDDYILVSGQIEGGDCIYIDIPATTGSYKNLDVYICMYKQSGSTFTFLPLPKQGDFNPAQMKLSIYDDAEQGGGGIPGGNTEEMFQNVEFSYAINGEFKTAWICTDNGTAEWCLRSGGTLCVKMLLSNKSGASKTIYRQDFTLDLDGKTVGRTPSTMYNANKATVSYVKIPNNGTATIYLEFNAIFNDLGSDWDYSNKNSSWSMDFTRSGSTLFGGDIYAMKDQATPGWTQR